jgi:D,D-heptose 1,7-bisphosphate phosphatase
MTQAIILAGGKGTRLKSILGDIPKPLVDICGTPLLEHQILHLKEQSFTNIIILVNHLADTIISFCKSKNNWGLEIQIIDDGEPLGTAGAVLKIFDKLEDEFLVVYGDTMFNVDLFKFFQFHKKDPTISATLFLHPNDHPYDSDLVVCDENNVIKSFLNYPHDSNLYYSNIVNAALYFINKSSLFNWINNKNLLDFAKNLFPEMISKGLLLKGYISPEYIKDCGTPDRVQKVCIDFQKSKIKNSNLKQQQKAIFIDRDGTLNKEVGHLSDINNFELIEDVDIAIKKINRSSFKSIIITNQPVIARGECTLMELKNIHNKLETELGKKNAYVDKIIFCPHYPISGFKNEIINYKIDCNCRKPNIGMILEAKTAFNIDLSQSWLIGDSTTDIMTAKNACINSILVQTGYAGLDSKHFVIPDFIFQNLKCAIDFIIDEFEYLSLKHKNIFDNISHKDLIFIGGQSRSGKSTFSSVLKINLNRKNINTHVLSTDFWLLDEIKRGKNVLERHDYREINRIIDLLINRTSTIIIDLPFYDKQKKKSINNNQKLIIQPNDVIIIEGILSLFFAEKVKSNFKFFVNCDEKIRKTRLINEYMTRGLSYENSLKIYNERLTEEIPWVNQTKKSAKDISI